MGRVDGGFSAAEFWQVVVPTGATWTTNYVTNPSFETGTGGWSAISSTLTQTAGVGVVGGCCGRLLASATNGRANTSTASVGSGTHVVGSAWVKADSALVQLKLTIGASSAIQAHPGDGAWHRLEVEVTAPSSTTPALEVIDTRTSAWTNVDIDAVQVEVGDVATTYVDGDQDGCVWTGTPHTSTSYRDGRDGRGGVLSSFTALGLNVTKQTGLGVPPSRVAMQDRALGDGSFYSRTRFDSRVLQLTCRILYPTGLIGGLHSARAAIVSAFNLDTRTNRGPVLLRYTGAATPKLVPAYYDAGLEQQAADATFEETTLRFLTDPEWLGEAEGQAALNVNQTLSGVGFLAEFNGSGWSNMAGSATAVTNYANDATALLDGRIIVGGNFANMGGVSGLNFLAAWNSSAWSTLSGVMPNGVVNCLALDWGGSLYIGGVFTSLGGDANQTRIAKWQVSTQTWVALGTGGANAAVKAIIIDNAGFVWAAGDFTAIGGVTISKGVAYFDGSAWHDTTGSTLPAINAGNSYKFALGNDSYIYLAVNSTIYRWNSATWETFASADSTIYDLKNFNGVLYAAGAFTQMQAVLTGRIAAWSGAGWYQVGMGIDSGSASSLAQYGGQIWIAGAWQGGHVGGYQTTDSLAAWNGSTLQPFRVIDPPNTGTHPNDVYQIWAFPGHSEYLVGWKAGSGTFSTSMTVPGGSVTAVTNNGTANAYPVIEFTSSGGVYALQNQTTFQTITFNDLWLQVGERAVLDLRPGYWSFKSPFRDLLATISPDSDLASFCLVPSVNVITLRADGGTAVMHWHPRHWSADG